MKTEIAVFGGGCFWCTEAVFSMLKGVVSVMPGYAEGAEVIKIEYDPTTISYEDLLTVFFYTHDPTTLNRQSNDIGTQYRSIILYIDEEQKSLAEKFIQELGKSNAYERPIVTEIKPLEKFYEAEDYHKEYFKKNPTKAYCQLVIVPKIEKLEKRFKELLR